MEEEQQWRATGHPKVRRTCDDKDACKKPLWRNFGDFAGLRICIILSLLSLGVCVAVFLRTSELQSRIFSLEQQRDSQVTAWMSSEQVEPVILARLDRILEEVSADGRKDVLCYLLNVWPHEVQL